MRRKGSTQRGAAVLAVAVALLWPAWAAAAAPAGLGERARQYLIDLTRLDTSNPPGNESRVAEYLKRVADQEGIPCETIGGDPGRLNFVGRLRGDGARRPLLLMAHSDVVPADPAEWTVDPFSGELRDGYIYGRGAQDDKSLLASELAVLVELRRRGVPLARDVILLAEADEESGSTGVQWMVRHAWSRIDAEFAINEGGFIADLPSGRRLYQVQTSEKIPTRAILRARGTAAHASLPRPDNPVVRLARALVNLAAAHQPVRLNATTRRYLNTLARLEEYRWLAALVPRLSQESASIAAAGQIRSRDRELDAQLRTTLSPTLLHAGTRINVIPNSAEAQIDIRRLPDETREEVFARLRRIINDSSVDVLPGSEQEMPATEPSSLSTPLYRAMEQLFQRITPGAVVVPYMQRGATDGAFLRHKGMAVYGAPIFQREDLESRAHGNDERISIRNLEAGAGLLWEIVLAVAAR
jgi:acetylornithine deacetylase/succinyl-diaminopimelate desuccinylase-like protein